MLNEQQSLKGSLNSKSSLKAGEVCPRGPQGPKGPPGPQGPKGDDPLYSFTIEGKDLYLETEEELDDVSFEINSNGELEVIVDDKS